MTSQRIRWRADEYRVEILTTLGTSAPKIDRKQITIHPTSVVDNPVPCDDYCMVTAFEGHHVVLVGSLEARGPVYLISRVLLKKARVCTIAPEDIAVPTTSEELRLLRRQSYVPNPYHRGRR